MNKEIRKEKIKARDSLTSEKRELLSQRIVERILAWKQFQRAETIMIYKGIRGEVRLETLEKEIFVRNLSMEMFSEESLVSKDNKKKLIYPLCVSDTEMIALHPQDEFAWKTGYFGIQEPILERSEEISPEDIDLIICPCTVFDERCNRMGMGAGFYDRFLEKCTNAVVAAVAFECQKTDNVPRKPWDKPMDWIFTEEATYHCG